MLDVRTASARIWCERLDPSHLLANGTSGRSEDDAGAIVRAKLFGMALLMPELLISKMLAAE
ncbi:hypothetical protein HLH26_11865 [Gluconacetobacter sp. 1b LMG 1731]|uniref:Uncharacterized protein n=1 Tax=Gluconacetobacter dulcium TaxID=2729096 RepID=A0A7W4ILV6_9PROT|nr:hypothetical protein [Gluconacetobacter dulcium]MBB2165217.1 hypothetical protein [Gluconacetobacter dulcium]MBB2194374.1 hypothetical protein [Gluconacetobacter dulcium]